MCLLLVFNKFECKICYIFMGGTLCFSSWEAYSSVQCSKSRGVYLVKRTVGGNWAWCQYYASTIRFVWFHLVCSDRLNGGWCVLPRSSWGRCRPVPGRQTCVSSSSITAEWQNAIFFPILALWYEHLLSVYFKSRAAWCCNHVNLSKILTM